MTAMHDKTEVRREEKYNSHISWEKVCYRNLNHFFTRDDIPNQLGKQARVWMTNALVKVGMELFCNFFSDHPESQRGVRLRPTAQTNRLILPHHWDMRHGAEHGARHTRWCAVGKEEDSVLIGNQVLTNSRMKGRMMKLSESSY
jgi:hypothetical protein